MAEPLPKGMTVDEFVAWAMEQPRGRYELAGGEVVAMAPERSGHGRAKLRFARRLEEEVERLGLGCTAYGAGMTVRVDEFTAYEPDAMLRCGPDLPDDAVEVTDPLVIVEVRSRSTAGVDAGAKLADYFRLSSLCHYLIVRAEERAVIHHRRDDGGEITVRIVRDGDIPLDPPGIVLRDLFSRRRS